MKHKIKSKDRVITIDDIIDLNTEQLDKISSFASQFNAQEIIDLESGVKISLQKWQREIVLAHKNSLLENQDERALLKEGTVTFTKHARARVAVRVDKMSSESIPPSLDSVLLVVRLVIDSEIVDEDAEWKGKSNLVYTLLHTYLKEEFKVSVSFERFGNETIKVITVCNDHIGKLTQKLSQDTKIRQQLEDFKARIISHERHVEH
ncbi:hypothetical protein FZW96_11195 [Bacillus sp. BGMRC 2118]|nr:hypothetical protein FZW96_11195 [Bacillus sp. BGMRC 2118]